MKKENIIDKLICELKSVCPDCEIVVQRVLKNNSVEMEGVYIKKNGENISPIIYVDYFIDRILSGSLTTKEAAAEMAQISKETPGFLQNNRDIFSIIKSENFYLSAISKKMNAALLKNAPHIELCGDIVGIIRCRIDECATCVVKNDMLEHTGLKAEEALEIAVANTKNCEYDVFSLTDLVGDLANLDLSDTDLPLYVCTNKERMYGAAIIFVSEELRKRVFDLVGPYYILCSSIHEVIVVPKTEESNADYFAEMMSVVNDTEVDATEVLAFRPFFVAEDLKITEC